MYDFFCVAQLSSVYKYIVVCVTGSECSRKTTRVFFETPATTLRLFCEEFCRIKFLNMFKIFATTLRHLATHARILRITGDCFETALRAIRDACRQLSQNSRSPVR